MGFFFFLFSLRPQIITSKVISKEMITSGDSKMHVYTVGWESSKRLPFFLVAEVKNVGYFTLFSYLIVLFPYFNIINV